MVSGAFAKMVHDHEFFEHPDGTLMTDRFMFSSPFGIIGRIVDFRNCTRPSARGPDERLC